MTSECKLQNKSDSSDFDQLKQLIDSEPLDFATSDWRGMLAAIGILNGRPFNPDANARTLLDKAARTAYKTSRVLGFTWEKRQLYGRLRR